MKNLFLKLLAIFAAIVFWGIVVNLENTFYIFPEPVEIQAFNMPEQLSLKDELGTAILTLNIAPRDAQKISIRDFEVYVDLKNAAQGEHQLEVSVSSKKSEVRVLKIEPSVIKVNLEEVKEKKIALTYDTQGKPEFGYQVKKVELEQEEIKIRGSVENLAKVEEVRAIIVLDGSETTDIEKIVELEAVDSDNEKVEDISFDKEEITAQISIAPSLQTKTVGVNPVITGQLEGSYLKSLTVEPTIIRVQGTPQALNSVTSLQTKEILVSELAKKKTVSLPIVVPSGIQISAGEPKTVTITADIQKIDSPIPESATIPTTKEKEYVPLKGLLN